MEKYGFVYIWRDRKHNRYYIGCHWGSVDDGYLCSSTWMRNSYKRRPEDFKRRIIFKTLNKENMFEEEYRFLKLIKYEELGKKYYNFMIQKYNLTGKHVVSAATKQKMSEKKKGRIPWNKGKKCPSIAEHCKKREPISEETRLKMKMKKLGKTLSVEHRNKISESNMGRELSQKALDNLAFYRSKPKSEETKKKISNTKKGVSLLNKTETLPLP